MNFHVISAVSGHSKDFSALFQVHECSHEHFNDGSGRQRNFSHGRKYLVRFP
jgi:hypothetical protein